MDTVMQASISCTHPFDWALRIWFASGLVVAAVIGWLRSRARPKRRNVWAYADMLEELHGIRALQVNKNAIRNTSPLENARYYQFLLAVSVKLTYRLYASVYAQVDPREQESSPGPVRPKEAPE